MEYYIRSSGLFELVKKYVEPIKDIEVSIWSSI